MADRAAIWEDAAGEGQRIEAMGGSSCTREQQGSRGAGIADEVQDSGGAGRQTCRALVGALAFLQTKQKLSEGSERGRDLT